jgi:ABC-type nitrate/sulfonate/bicarbonate transport system permease component
VSQPQSILGRAGTSPALLGLIGLAAFGGLLEVLPRIGVLPAEYFPPSSQIATALWDEILRPGTEFVPSFGSALGDTIATWLTGLAIAVAGGLVFGVIIGAVPFLREATASSVEFLRPIPSVALIPGLIVLFHAHTSTLVIVVYASFWQMMIQVIYGVGDVDPVARDTARSYHLGVLRRVRYVLWPTALPYVLTGVRLAAAVALILTITGELIIGNPGLGRLITFSYGNPEGVPTMYALITVTGIIGVLANTVTRSAERRVLRWHPSVRGEIPV